MAGEATRGQAAPPSPPARLLPVEAVAAAGPPYPTPLPRRVSASSAAGRGDTDDGREEGRGAGRRDGRAAMIPSVHRPGVAAVADAGREGGLLSERNIMPLGGAYIDRVGCHNTVREA